MKYNFFDKDKLTRAELAVEKAGQDPKDEELVLAEYLKLAGRAEDEKGNKVLTPHDKSLGKERLSKREYLRKENLGTIKK